MREASSLTATACCLPNWVSANPRSAAHPSVVPPTLNSPEALVGNILPSLLTRQQQTPLEKRDAPGIREEERKKRKVAFCPLLLLHCLTFVYRLTYHTVSLDMGQKRCHKATARSCELKLR
jgi:hypothetical protein